MNTKKFAVVLTALLVLPFAAQAQNNWSYDSAANKVTTTSSVGIGTSTTPSQFNIFNSVASSNILTATTNSAYGGSMSLLDSSSARYAANGGVFQRFTGNSAIEISNMQLGWSGSAVIYALDGRVLWINTQSGAGDVYIGNPQSPTGLVVNGGGNSFFAGKVGIGINPPGAKLHILQNSTYNGPTNTPGLAITALTTDVQNRPNDYSLVEIGADFGNSIAYLQSHGNASFSNLPFVLQPNGGKVGIGVGMTNPSQTLSVAGIVQATGGFQFPDGLQTTAFQPSSGSMRLTTSTAPKYTLESSTGQQSAWWNGTGTYIDVGGAVTASNNFIAFRTTNVASSNTTLTEAMRVTSTGQVGIGTNGPPSNGSYKLEVNGNANIIGTLTATSVVNAVYGQDVAEWVRGDRELASGTVVIVNPEKTNEVMPSSTAYDTTVAGVVSAQPGVILGRPGELKATVATSGRVRVRVDARKGAVHVGDLLVTSDEPGTAMKSQPIDVGGRKFHQPGTILGKALEPLPEGVGEILVLLCLG